MYKLLYLTNQICGSGGLERVLSIKASYLADKMDYEVHIITLNQGSQDLFYNFSNKLHFHDISISSNPIVYVLNYITGIRKIIKHIQPHFICVCDDGLKGFFVPQIVGNQCPVIYERHVSRLIVEGENKTDLKQKLLIKFNYILMDYGAKKFSAFIVLTKGNLEEWHSNNLKVISNPLSFYPKETALVKNKKIIAVGKHCHQKGYDRLLPIWKIVIEKHPDWILDIYGSTNPDHDLNSLAKNLQINDNVIFHKPDKNIKERLIESSILVLTSRYEGFGMVLTEAMACGLPIISFDCPHGPSDIISQGKDGILVKNGDLDSFAKALIDLIENEDKRTQMGQTAKQNVKRFLPENIMKQWDELFKSLIKE